jgi:hypothetical protein
MFNVPSHQTNELAPNSQMDFFFVARKLVRGENLIEDTAIRNILVTSPIAVNCYPDYTLDGLCIQLAVELA